MSATSAPFGLRPAYHPSGLDRATEFPIAATYNTAIYKGSPCTLTSNSLAIAAASGADWLGAFDGVEYTDINGKPTKSNYWPGAVTGATLLTAYVWADPLIVYECQSLLTVAQTAVGRQMDFDTTSVGTGSTSTGLSNMTLTGTTINSGSQGMVRILDKGGQPDNAWGDAYVILQVQNARSIFVANKVAV